MKEVSKEQVEEMFRLGILKNIHGRCSNLTVCNKQRGSKKTRYVSEDKYEEYQKIKAKEGKACVQTVE